jgi:hypothetical protein
MKMDAVIAYCGLICQGCPIHWATRQRNEEKKRKMRAGIAQQIKEQYGEELKPEDITDCDGCKTEGGRLFSGCKDCRIRNCARRKRLDNCAQCSEYACEELKNFFVTDPEARARLDVIRSTL